MQCYNISSDGRKNIYYEDDTCKINVVVADFRDSIWWVGEGKALNKITQEQCKLTKNQLFILFKRIACDSPQKEVFNEKFGFIKSEDDNILIEDEINILEVE